MATAAALQGKTINDVLSQQGDLAPGKTQATGMPGGCFGCGLMGHQVRRCPDRRASLRTKREPGLYRRYRRGKHWTSKCRSKRDDLDNSLSGNRFRGQSQAPQQIYGAIQQSTPPTRRSIQDLFRATPGSARLDLSSAV